MGLTQSAVLKGKIASQFLLRVNNAREIDQDNSDGKITTARDNAYRCGDQGEGRGKVRGRRFRGKKKRMIK